MAAIDWINQLKRSPNGHPRTNQDHVATWDPGNGDPVIISQFMVVTPEIARDWLASMEANRPISERNITTLSKAMADGKWLFTGETFKFGWNNSMLDAQHRCRAIINSGKSILALVVQNIDPAGQDIMDQGKKRTLGDALAMHGYDNYNSLAAAIRLMRVHEDPHAGTANTSQLDSIDRAWNHADSIEYLRQHPLLEAGVNYATKLKPAITNKIAPSVIGFCYAIFDPVNHARNLSFWTKLSEVEFDKGTGDPCKTLFLKLEEFARVTYHVENREKLYYLFRCFKAHRKGLSLMRLTKPSPETLYDNAKFPDY